MIVIDKMPGDEIPINALVGLLGHTVEVTVADGPRQVQNGPTRYAGTVVSVSQRDAAGRHRDAGDGSIHMEGGLTARWTKFDLVTIRKVGK